LWLQVPSPYPLHFEHFLRKPGANLQLQSQQLPQTAAQRIRSLKQAHASLREMKLRQGLAQLCALKECHELQDFLDLLSESSWA
jgi:hypothetical protein